MADDKAPLALFVPTMGGGGAQRAMLRLAWGIAERGHAVDLVLSQATGPFLAEVPRSVRVVDLNAPRVLSSLPGLVRYLQRERPRAMLAALTHANIAALWARRLAGVPTRLIVSQRTTLRVSPGRWPNRRGHLLPFLIRHFYGWADAIVAISGGVADDVARVTRIPRGHIQVIYNPVVTPGFRKKAEAPLEHPWFEAGGPPVLLGVGRLCPQKDFSTLIQAFAQARKERSARLLILGEGRDRPALEAMVRELGLEQDVALPGFIENPYPYMVRASLFVLSSRWEGLGNVLVEAMYCGVPLVATDCPHGPREILVDGKYGTLIPVGDASALARAIQAGLNGKALRPPPESWQPFEAETAVSQYLDVLLGRDQAE